MLQTRDSQRGCVIIPALNEERRIADVVRRVRDQIPEVVVVDDGSRDGTAREAGAAGATVLKHEVNRGKGAALETGFRYACERGFDFAVTMDGDGQHDPDDLPRFIEAHARTGIPVWVGNRMADTGSMPFVRRMTNRYMSWLLSREMGQSVPDTQCGYRLFHCTVIPHVAVETTGFAAESEVLLKLADRDIRIGSVAVATIYRDEKSKISPIRDALRFFGMLRRHRRSRRLRKTL